jgi:hypothetical protein
MDPHGGGPLHEGVAVQLDRRPGAWMTRNGGVLYVGPAHLGAQREAVEG